MASTLYLECSSGISGDMAVAALLDLGADEGALMEALDGLGVGGFEARVSRVSRSGLDACDFDVAVEGGGRDCDPEYLYGPAPPPEPEARGPHRGLAEILEILSSAPLTGGARALAERTFRILASAEAAAHGVPVGEVHFHEVGAVDSIADVVSFAVCYDGLGFDGAVVTGLCEGTGTVRCRHGVLPVPVPAVVNIAREHGIPITVLDVRGEHVTPTGAAIAAAVRTSGELPPRFVVEGVGMGAGKRPTELSGLLRAFAIRPLPASGAGRKEIYR